MISPEKKLWMTGQTRPVAWRKSQLRALHQSLQKHEKEILAALHSDLKNPKAKVF